MIETTNDAETYCSDCGCISDDEICPRCRAEIADAQSRNPDYRGDRRWNGQIMSRRNDELDGTVLSDVREMPGFSMSRRCRIKGNRRFL
jgi:hypothetical protein